jgi:hypothetical protein
MILLFQIKQEKLFGHNTRIQPHLDNKCVITVVRAIQIAMGNVVDTPIFSVPVCITVQEYLLHVTTYALDALEESLINV